jgi:RsiW-degrading membrane proteinase PrsW (M82 family)
MLFFIISNLVRHIAAKCLIERFLIGNLILLLILKNNNFAVNAIGQDQYSTFEELINYKYP